MLGIDIVDLKDSKLRERNERSLKLIQNKEDQLIEHEFIYWLLWSAKEAVFKCRREAINFSPTSIPIHLKKAGEQIQFESDGLKGKLIVEPSYILAICSDDLDSTDYEIISGKGVIDGGDVRNIIVNFFSNLDHEVTIGSDDLNLPILLPSEEAISISHHNHLAAFIFPRYLTK